MLQLSTLVRMRSLALGVLCLLCCDAVRLDRRRPRPIAARKQNETTAQTKAVGEWPVSDHDMFFQQHLCLKMQSLDLCTKSAVQVKTSSSEWNKASLVDIRICRFTACDSLKSLKSHLFHREPLQSHPAGFCLCHRQLPKHPPTWLREGQDLHCQPAPVFGDWPRCHSRRSAPVWQRGAAWILT